MAPKTALVVIDMQNFFESMTTTALPNIIRLITHFTSTRAPIIFTQHGHTGAELTTTPSPNQLVRKWGPGGSIAAGSEDWQIIEPLHRFLPPTYSGKAIPLGHSEPEPEGSAVNDWPKVVPKNTYDAFINTNLAQVLESAGVERVVVCGVMTDCCVDTTGRSAFNRGYETWLVEDASGSANRKQHEAGLRGFGFAFGEVLRTGEVLDRL
ncbi:hypothetical protein HRR83_007656 [Exophiala dermatitidis]|uniref:Isochorismatase-like domain-containing protein n=2 Tax=Exophiala dermatitidis TaxID=5970 RepID=H6BL47_EXODN|nr:uncharacterized protein HMPREF1120_01002 [Exophiala dermatitidis NIH/UT8656]KAJ4509955.1 hypothetical protein HRR74_007107 [Exophiala dermatitidis]EHY52795.1 hypothetical protein HMPREF1120_01002 [Exophiala dermatitidis NIH/UT8656]KAJ4521794.1 hypothetical protein HRR73_002992 [Exophiala dermatitidis]KAJ4539489.1 hypothetical protein HRR77_006372 [Exophiala dermatitidis]KAJ4548432.1 hypothetical protein HRR76_001032 [Exophiala dermatitidis]